MEYKVNVDNFDRKEWELCAQEFADYSIYQTWPYQQMRAEMDRQEISRFMIKNNLGCVVTMGQVRIKRIKLLRLAIGYIQWGSLVKRHDGTSQCDVEAFLCLRKAYVGSRVDILRIVPNVLNDEFGERLSDMLIASGFCFVKSVAPYRTLLVETAGGEEEIKKRLHKSFRRDLRNAEKADIKICRSCDDEYCNILEELYLESLKRKGFHGLDVREFVKAQHMLSPAEKMEITVAYFEGKPVSAFLASNLGDTAIVLLAASNDQGLRCGSSYRIWYHGLVSALNADLKYCDLGGIDPEKNPNVYQFKSRMGGREVYHIGAFETSGGGYAKILLAGVEKFNRIVKRWRTA